jgi:hypothetical protein
MKLLTTRRQRQLRTGDQVEIRPIQEILLTLDATGGLEGLPFMPEMVEYCGKRFEVLRRADKTCDESNGGCIRSLKNTVHLRELRCGGAFHGGCDAGCLLFWKEQWLKNVDSSNQRISSNVVSSEVSSGCTLSTLVEATRAIRSNDGNQDESFSCQSTEISAFSSPLPWWNVGQYLRDLLSRNVTIGDFVTGMFIGAFNLLQHFRNERAFGSLSGSNGKTPQANLNLAPGDLVQIKPKNEISQTLNSRGKNCGLSFRPEMLSYCGGQYRVVRRVKQIIRPKTGKMISLSGNCVILEGVVCTGKMKRFCPRMVYTYWRDIWLTKVVEAAPVRAQEQKPVDDQTDYGTAARIPAHTSFANPSD